MTAPTSTIRLHRQPPGFSLLELGVVVALIALVLALCAPVISNVRKSAGTARCISNLRQLGVAIVTHAAEHNGTLPVGRDYTNGVKYWFMERSMWAYRYLGADLDTARLFRCPTDAYITDHKYYYSYTWNVNFLEDRRGIDDPKVYLHEAAGKVLMADGASLAERTGEKPASNALSGIGPIHSGSKSAPNLSKRHKDGANCLMGDGSVQWLPSKEILTPRLLDRS